MPNWFTTRVKPKNPEVFKELFYNGDTPTFEKLLPMHSDLNITCPNTYSFRMFENDYDKVFHETIEPLIEGFYTDEISQEDFVQKCKDALDGTDAIKRLEEALRWRVDDFWGRRGDDFRGFFNCRRYGWADWYDWRVNNWGTKWDVGEDDVWDLSDGIWEMQTAWSAPMDWLRAVSLQTPLIMMGVDEGDNYARVYIFNSGVEYEIDPTPFVDRTSLALHIRGDEDAQMDFATADEFCNKFFKLF